MVEVRPIEAQELWIFFSGLGFRLFQIWTAGRTEEPGLTASLAACHPEKPPDTTNAFLYLQ